MSEALHYMSNSQCRAVTSAVASRRRSALPPESDSGDAIKRPDEWQNNRWLLH